MKDILIDVCSGMACGFTVSIVNLIADWAVAMAVFMVLFTLWVLVESAGENVTARFWIEREP